MRENRKSITFIITWGTTRVVSWTVGLGGLGGLLLLALVIFSIPGGILLYEQMSLSLDRSRFEANQEDYERMRGEFVSRLDHLIAYEERVSIMIGRELSPGAFDAEMGGVGGGETALEAEPAGPDTLASAGFQARQNILASDWSQKVDWLRRSLVWDIDYAESRREQLQATPSIIPVVNGLRSSGFGRRPSPFTGRSEFHRGLDISHREGTPVIAPAAGEVVLVGRVPFLGLQVRIKHGYGFETFYGHLSRAAVQVGRAVSRGEVIAYLGSTGRATGPHLHYQIEYNGIAIDPENYILDWGRNR